MSDYPMLISNKLHSFRNFLQQTYIKTLDFYASPIKNKTTSLSFALFVLLVHNFLLSLGLQLLTYKLAYYETSMWS
jgi:hypothetical protein